MRHLPCDPPLSRVSSSRFCGQDVQGVHRNDLVKTMRGVFRENLKSRMTVRDIGALEAFSAKVGTK